MFMRVSTFKSRNNLYDKKYTYARDFHAIRDLYLF